MQALEETGVVVQPKHTKVHIPTDGLRTEMEDDERGESYMPLYALVRQVRTCMTPLNRIFHASGLAEDTG